jgi:cell division protein FtsX
MQIDGVLSTAMLAALVWSLRFLLPKAIKEHDRFVLICALLTAALALIAWLFFAVGIRSERIPCWW